MKTAGSRRAAPDPASLPRNERGDSGCAPLRHASDAQRTQFLPIADIPCYCRGGEEKSQRFRNKPRPKSCCGSGSGGETRVHFACTRAAGVFRRKAGPTRTLSVFCRATRKRLLKGVKEPEAMD